MDASFDSDLILGSRPGLPMPMPMAAPPLSRALAPMAAMAAPILGLSLSMDPCMPPKGPRGPCLCKYRWGWNPGWWAGTPTRGGCWGWEWTDEDGPTKPLVVAPPPGEALEDSGPGAGIDTAVVVCCCCCCWWCMRPHDTHVPSDSSESSCCNMSTCSFVRFPKKGRGNYW